MSHPFTHRIAAPSRAAVTLPLGPTPVAESGPRRRVPQRRIGILVEPRYLAQAQPRGLGAALQAMGHDVRLIGVKAYEVGHARGLEGYDLLVARGRSWGVLGLLAWAERQGTPVINSSAAIAAVHNKAEMAMRLAEGGVRTPRTFVGRVADLAHLVPATCYPLILKPLFGDNGKGIVLVTASEELKDLEWPEETALAQQYLANDGFDIKLYGIGEQLWAVRKRSPLVRAACADTLGEATLLTRELDSLGRQCARLFGLQFYGIDCLQAADGPVVIEVNDFPNYTGVAGADEALARHVVRHAHRQTEEVS